MPSSPPTSAVASAASTVPAVVTETAVDLGTTPASHDDRFARAGAAFADLCRVMAKLRMPGGCPWDAVQTFETLKPYLLEEAYEALEAMDGTGEEHRDELGDLLLQVVFQAEIAQETARFDIAQVADAIRHKLIRRHPHVFGDKAAAKTAEAALANWEALKAEERAKKGAGTTGEPGKPASAASVLDGVPRALPALLRAMRSGEKAAAVGFDWLDATGAAEKVDEEWAEVRAALGGPREAVAEEMGDLLFSIANVCRHLGIDPETSLRFAVDKFARRFRRVEASLSAAQKKPKDVGMDELNRLWDEAKAVEKVAGRAEPGTV